MDQTLLLIPAPLVGELLEYLAARPYREVAPVMAILSQLKPAPLTMAAAPASQPAEAPTS